MATIMEKRDLAVREYENLTSDMDSGMLAKMICHYDDIIQATEISCFGKSEHKRYFNETY